MLRTNKTYNSMGGFFKFILIQYQFSQKIMWLENCEFNRLTNILTHITRGSKLLNKHGPTSGILNFSIGR